MKRSLSLRVTDVSLVGYDYDATVNEVSSITINKP